MSNKDKLSLVVTHGFQLADQIVANEFDYGDGAVQRKRIAIALNVIARSEGVGMREMWTNNMINDSGKANIINGLKERPTNEADDALTDVWDHMTDEHKQMHLNNHPESRFHVVQQHQDAAQEHNADSEVQEQQEHEERNEELRERHKRRNRNKRVRERNRGTEDDKDDDWWNNMSMTEQRQYLRAHPKSKKARRWRIGIRNLAMKATHGIHSEIRKMGHEYRSGMDGIRAMRNGRKMTDEQKENLKKVAGRMAKLLVGALAVSAMFTPLGPFVLEVGDKYFDHLKDRGSELENDHRRDNSDDENNETNENRPTTVGQTDGNRNGGNSDTTVGQTEPAVSESGVNIKLNRKNHALHQQNEMELEWMRRDMTEWLLNSDVDKMVKDFKRFKK